MKKVLKIVTKFKSKLENLSLLSSLHFYSLARQSLTHEAARTLIPGHRTHTLCMIRKIVTVKQIGVASVDYDHEWPAGRSSRACGARPAGPAGQGSRAIGAKHNLYCKAIELVCGGSSKI